VEKVFTEIEVSGDKRVNGGTLLRIGS